MMIAKIIVAIILMIVLICVIYGAFEGIRNNDDKLTLICSMSAGLVGLLLGFILGSFLK